MLSLPIESIRGLPDIRFLSKLCRQQSAVLPRWSVVGGSGGDEETRTPDPLLAKEMLCQLSYVPVESQHATMVGAPGLEPGTSALSGPRSNQLSYAPRMPAVPVWQGGCTDNP